MASVPEDKRHTCEFTSFNGILVTLGRCEGDNERLCAVMFKKEKKVVNLVFVEIKQKESVPIHFK